MSEVNILAVVVGALWGLVLSLVAVVWSTLKERLTAQETKVGALEAQNTAQETALGRLVERMVARENAHNEHREMMGAQFERLDSSIRDLSGKIDRLLGGRTPYPTQYRTGEKQGGE